MVAKRTSRYRGPVGSGNPTGVNSSSACLRTPREIHISDSVAYFTGVAKSVRIGGDHLDLLNRGHTIPLGFGNSLSRYPIKLHQLTTRVELFYFVCLVGLKAYFTEAHTISPGASCGQKQRESMREEFGNS